MAKVSSKTVRVLEIPQEVEKDEFLAVAKRLSSKAVGGGWLSKPLEGDEKPVTSYAPQFDGHAGTITLPSEKHKAEALANHGTEWKFDDVFNRVTVLFSAPDPDIDICALHGLDGNAFETWTAKTNGKMWLRDFLPYSKPFDNARIMTFGYSSQISDRADLSGMGVWAHNLLVEMSSVRQSQKEQQRPIIFVCHSMGGLVARQAMIRLNEYYHKPEYEGISLKRCGLLFLSTPHSGSTEADWNKFVVDIAQLTFGIRPEILNYLKSFNPLSAEAQEDFANMKHQPPFDGFYETRRTRIANIYREIVTWQSASLAGHMASPMDDVDHSTICKFDQKIGGFMRVANKLRYLRGVLMGQESNSGGPNPNKPWSAPAIAPNCPQPEGKKFFEGGGLNQRSKMKGRQLELKSLRQIVEQTHKTKKSAVAITGIGGIGKTATLLEIAHQESNQRNIFFIHATGAASLHQAYLHIAKCIGPEYLLKEFRGRDVQAIWSNESEEDKVGRFKFWLNDPENADALFLLDDMDGILELENREAAFPDEAKTILYTTRNPVFHKDNIRSRHKIRLSIMETEDIIKLMEDVRNNERPEYGKTADLYNRETLLGIVDAVQGHPLAASNAIKYIIRVESQYEEATAGSRFVATIAGNNYQARQHFLSWKPDSPSILETFEVSQSRLSKPDAQARALMNFLSLIETRSGDDFDFRDFFFEHSCPVPVKNFPDHMILGAERFQLQDLFSELEKVSFGERVETSAFQFHPLWLECTRHSMSTKGRTRYARQILLICYHMMCVDHGIVEITADTDDSFLPHVRRCLQVSESFKIGLGDLKLPAKVSKFLKGAEDSH